MKKCLRMLALAVILLPAFCSLHAQEITVRDRSTLQPIERATILNIRTGASAITDEHGKAALAAGNADDSIRISHLGYHLKTLTSADIRNNNGDVLLSERLLSMGEVVVAANKWEEDRREIPVQIVPISPKDIAFTNPQTTADMLSTLGGVYVQKSQMGGGSAVIRGYEANKVLMVVDGVRMNNAIYRSGHLQNVIMFDAASMENAEVVFGPGSVIYGSDALGGVMDFHMWSPRYSRDGGLDVSGGAFARYATANAEKTGHIHFNIGLKDLAFMTSVTYTDFDDLRMGGIGNPFYPDWGKRFEYVERVNGVDEIKKNDDPNVQKGTAYDQLNILEKVSYRFSDYLNAQYGFYYSTTSDIPRYDRLTQYKNGKLRYAEWYYGPQNWMMNSLRINFAKPDCKVASHARLTVAYQTIDEDRISRSLNKPDKTHQEEDVNVLTINLDVDKDLAKDVHRLFYGFEAVMNDVTSTAYTENIETGARTPAATRYPDGDNTLNSFAAYASYKWDVSELLLLSAGARFSQSSLKSTLVNKDFFDFPFSEINIDASAVNGSIGAVLRPGCGWQFDVNFGSGFRAPNLDDAGKVFDSSPGMIIVPNPDLKPEYAYNGELTIIKEFGNTSYFSATGFYTTMSDAIVVRDFQFNGQDSLLYDGSMSKVQASQNVGEAYRYGFTGTFSADVTPDFTIASSLTYTYGWDESGDAPLDHIPPLYLTTRFIYRYDRFRSELALMYNGWKHLKDYSPSGEDNLQNATAYGTPEWYTLSLRTSYQLTQMFQVNLALENLTDEHYLPFASGVHGAGRSFTAAVRATF